MLAEQGFTVSVNRQRNVTAGLAVVLAVAGAVKPSADVSGRRIVVITDAGRRRRDGRSSHPDGVSPGRL